jgi:hypothetical protein
MSFYGWLWRLLPGPKLVKVLEAAVLFALVVAALFAWVFPALDPLMPFNNNTVGQ